MAAPITHIVAAQRYLRNFPNQFSANDFQIGTSSPDIRYLGVIDRSKTHVRNVRIDTLNSHPSFYAGALFHSYLDEFREQLVMASGIYSQLTISRYSSQAVKLFEDTVLFEEIQGHQDLEKAFQQILPEEQQSGIDSEDLQRWHGLLIRYFRQMPTDNDRAYFCSQLGFSDQAVVEMNGIVHTIRNSPNLTKTIKTYLDRLGVKM